MPDQPEAPLPDTPVFFHVDYVPFVDFAMQQNAVPLLRALSIENRTDEQCKNLLVRIWSEPPVFAEKSFRVDVLAPRSSYAFADVALTLLREPLRKQTEREEGHLWIEAVADGTPIHKQPLPLSVLAYNEWYGVSSLPEIIAAHVLPNDPAVERILSEASKILLEGTKDGALSGYQSCDPRRAYSEAAAIYWAAARQNIAYVNPPASFEKTGQKIRTPEHILNCKLATCMDTATLLAACFEQAGLRPVVVLIKEHAFPGVWLVDKSFDEPVTRHPSILANRVALGEFLVIESIGITRTPTPDFKTAQSLAAVHLQNDARFHYAIDVKSARAVGIRPLSLTDTVPEATEGTSGVTSGPPTPGMDLVAPESIVGIDAGGSARTPRETESAADRLARWKTSLLDLSLRNRLLNFKDTKKSIPLLCPNIAALEDALAANETFRVRPKPEAWGENDPRDASLRREQTGEDALADYLGAEMAQRTLHAAVTDNELAVRLTEVERAARLGLEEGGANTLFLALGFLVYRERGESDVELRAPILLVPMSIERTTVRDGFRIRRIDEEVRINVTLLEKLRLDFGIAITGLDPLPEDESGLDVQGILRILRDAIKRQPGWQVVEDASISILTFSRFLMWVDLEANATILKENAIVRHMMETSNEPFEPGAAFPEVDRLDDGYPPSGTFCPLPADSSQLRAVFAAAEGRTFVLQGPPGTGKSQTITNLISQCLTIGKRVLFVAQKRAALDVVHRRVADIGLGPFCLELYSNKTTRESFRTQLNEALKIAGGGPGESWEAETHCLGELRRGLNEYICDLHQPRAFGKSAYWVISRLAAGAGKSAIPLELGDPAGRPAEEFERMRAAVRELAEAVKVSGNPLGHPLGAVRLSRWTYGIEDEARPAIQATGKAYGDLRAAARSILPDLARDADEASRDELKIIEELTSLLEKAPMVTGAILEEADWQRVKPELSRWIELGRGCAARRATLLETYAEELFSLDLQGLIDKLRTGRQAWFLKKWRLASFVRNAVCAVRKDGRKPADLAALERDLGTALTVIKATGKLNEQGSLASRLFGPLWQGAASDWSNLLQVVDWVERYRPILDRAPGADLDAKLMTRHAWIRLATEGRSIFAAGSPGAQKAQLFRDALKAAEECGARLGELLRLDVEAAWGAGTDGGMLGRAELLLRDLAGNLSRLREWSHYQSAREAAVNLRLTGLVEALERGDAGAGDLETLFEKSFADWWARKVLKSIPTLSGFIGERHDLKIREFREQEARIAELTRRESFARIAGGLPRAAAAGQRTPASSEAGMLQRFAQGGRRTIRRVFRECPNALARYKPCVMMSPLSVAQFIGADFPKFDLVVFDEASQMPTYEAIGAIARGAQLVVVGDSRQLPPTTFFERQKGDDEVSEDDLPEELESILGEAEASGIRPIPLNWHYRSRHESLIAFSNRQYYENRLHTFPSALAEHPRLGVHWREISDGVYDYAKSRTNRKEAEAVVAEIVRRLRNPDEQGESLGVVTFSTAQQCLVEDLLDAARGEYPEIEPYFTKVDEPVFIKNLETVQGDERDVILFSICYGPDAAGAIRMNFGPLNNKGGERRLNVAVTRARKQLLVFSTIRPEQIDLSRTSAVGVRHLRLFLDYAKRGHVALVEQTAAARGEVESPFEKSVCEELTKRGWRVDCQVGCSGYRIDLAIQDPDAPGRYLLGVECDGANYHSAKSARDRDRIRQVILEGLGWQLHRIWSTDWWLQRSREIVKLEEAIGRAKIKAGAAVAVDLGPPANIRAVQEPAPTAGSELPDAGAPFARAVPVPVQSPSSSARVVEVPPERKVYRRCESKSGNFNGELHDPANAATVRRLALAIAEVEAPVLFDTLCSEIAACWGLQRAGSRIREVVKSGISQSGLIVRRSGDREFVWTKELAGRPYEGYRVPDESDPNPRQVQEICPEEIANAAAQVLAENISIQADDFARAIANVFGIRRLGTNVRAFVDEGIELLQKQGRCRVEGTNVIAP